MDGWSRPAHSDANHVGGHAGPPRALVGIRDLDLVDPDRWPEAIRLLAGSPDTARALADPAGYPAWWLARYAVLGGRSPRCWRLPDAHDITGLYDPVPDCGLDENLLVTVGVRARLAIVAADDAQDLLDRLGDPDRDVPAGVALRAHTQLIDALRTGVIDADEIEPPERVRALSGSAIAAERAAVLDRPWLLGVLSEDRILAADGTADEAEALADLVGVPLASEIVTDAAVESAGESLDWSEMGAVELACELIGARPPTGSVLLHDELMVRSPDGSHRVSWWLDDDGRPHAEDSAESLARALAWTLDRWSDRWALAGLLTEPSPGTWLG
ncbi:MAG TPA: hypothetical protein VF444_17250 [Pseudonocardiaceae bacterium]